MGLNVMRFVVTVAALDGSKISYPAEELTNLRREGWDVVPERSPKESAARPRPVE